MRIIYLGAFRMPNGDAAAARVLNIGRALRFAGHEVLYISWGGEKLSSNLCADGKYRIDGFEYTVTNELDPKGNLLQKMNAKFRRGKKTKQELRERLGQYDAIITYNGNMSAWLVRFTKKHKVKLVSDLTEWYDYNELKVTDWIPYTFNMLYTQKKVKNKITISTFFDKYYNTTHNIIVPASCDASEAKWKISPDKEKKGVFEGITLIYAGNPARKDALHYVVNVVQRLIEEGTDLRFLIVGTERDCYLKSYGDLLTKKTLSEMILFLGRIPQEDVPSYYNMADFMILLREPTRKNNAGFPTKLAESFISGTPVIANLTSDIGLYLKDEETGYVVPEPTEEAIYSTLKEKVIVTSRTKIAIMKDKVKETSKQLDYHAYIEPLQKFMDSLL